MKRQKTGLSHLELAWKCWTQYLVNWANLLYDLKWANAIQLLFKSLSQASWCEFPLSCLFPCVRRGGGIGRLTFSTFARTILLTFLFEMLPYLRLGDKMLTDKGQTLNQMSCLRSQTDLSLLVDSSGVAELLSEACLCCLDGSEHS